MNNQEFIEAIKLHVLEAAVEDTISNLKSPPGRKIQPQEQAISDWYKGLTQEKIKYVNNTVAKAVHEAIFGLLAVLDGVRTIDDGMGRFELTYVTEQRILLNDPQTISLHDLLNATD